MKIFTREFFIGLTLPILVICAYFLIYLGYSYVYSIIFAENEIKNTVIEIKGNETSHFEIAKKIMEWEQRNIYSIYSRPNIMGISIIPKFPFLCWRNPNPNAQWVMATKCGACEELSILFFEMTKNAGIESRIVRNPGEDHSWNEIKINDEWINFDVGVNVINDTKYYERQNGMNKNLSYVFAEDSENKLIDITNRYTDTGKLIVSIQESGKPLGNVKIIVKSMFLMENNKMYKSPRYATECITNSSGVCVFNLGGNDYTVVAQKRLFDFSIGFKDEKVIKLEENTTLLMNLSPIKLDLLLTEEDRTFLIEIIIAIVLWVFIFWVIYKKYKRKNIR